MSKIRVIHPRRNVQRKTLGKVWRIVPMSWRGSLHLVEVIEALQKAKTPGTSNIWSPMKRPKKNKTVFFTKEGYNKIGKKIIRIFKRNNVRYQIDEKYPKRRRSMVRVDKYHYLGPKRISSSSAFTLIAVVSLGVIAIRYSGKIPAVRQGSQYVNHGLHKGGRIASNAIWLLKGFLEEIDIRKGPLFDKWDYESDLKKAGFTVISETDRGRRHPGFSRIKALSR